MLFQVTYHKLETFNGDEDSSSTVVSEPRFSLDQLQPGRNYSISVSAVSNNIESVPVAVFQATSRFPIRYQCLVGFKYPVHNAYLTSVYGKIPIFSFYSM